MLYPGESHGGSRAHPGMTTCEAGIHLGRDISPSQHLHTLFHTLMHTEGHVQAAEPHMDMKRTCGTLHTSSLGKHKLDASSMLILMLVLIGSTCEPFKNQFAFPQA